MRPRFRLALALAVAATTADATVVRAAAGPLLLICRGEVTSRKLDDKAEGRRWVAETRPFTSRIIVDFDRRQLCVDDCRADARPITTIDADHIVADDNGAPLIRQPGLDERIAIDRRAMTLTRDVTLDRCPQCVFSQPAGVQHWAGRCEDTAW